MKLNFLGWQKWTKPSFSTHKLRMGMILADRWCKHTSYKDSKEDITNDIQHQLAESNKAGPRVKVHHPQSRVAK